MYELVYLHYWNHTAHRFGYQVRIANSWNAYDWLGNKTIDVISKAMQNSKADETIHNLLKIALLMENGGILIGQQDTVFLGDSFEWVERMFNGADEEGAYLCKPE